MDIIYRYDPYHPIAPRQLEDAAAAIAVLQQGHERYAHIVTQVHRELMGDRSAGPVVIPSDPLSLGMPAGAETPPFQTPFALVLGCSDARVPIEQIFDQSLNDLFVIRVAGTVLGVECLGSIDYAVNQLGASLKLLVVLGHSSCGAVGAAVDSYLAPKDYASIAFTHALRSLVDRIQVAVRGAATALERVAGASVVRHSSYRLALIEAAVYLNAAITAFDVRREVDRLVGDAVPVVYGVFDLVQQRVRARPCGDSGDGPGPIPIFADVPAGPDDFAAIGLEIARAVAARRLPPEPAGNPA